MEGEVRVLAIAQYFFHFAIFRKKIMLTDATSSIIPHSVHNRVQF